MALCIKISNAWIGEDDFKIKSVFKDNISSGICFKINGPEIKSASVPEQNLKSLGLKHTCNSQLLWILYLPGAWSI